MITKTELQAEQIPGPQNDSIIDSATNFAEFLNDPVAYMVQMHERFGALSALRGGEAESIFAFGADLNREVYTNTNLFHSVSLLFESQRQTAQYRLSQSIFTLNGEEHRDIRKLLAPLMRESVNESHWGSTVEIARKHFDRWPLGTPVNLHELMLRLSFHLSMTNLLGFEPTEDDLDMIPPILKWSKLNNSPGVRVAAKGDTSAALHRMHEQAAALEVKLREIIARKRASQPNDDLFSRTLRAHDSSSHLTEELLAGHLIILMSAAFETTAGVLTWFLLLMAQHPQQMRNVVGALSDELDGNPPEPAQTKELVELNNAIDEAMRMLPPAVYTVRKNIEPTTLNGFPIKQNSRIFNSPYITHRNPDIYSEPAKFIPDRWFEINPGPFDFIPFGAGPRICLGNRSALLTMRVVLSMLLQEFQVNLIANSRIDRAVSVTMLPKNGVPAILDKQKLDFNAVPLKGSINDMVDFG